MRAAISNVSIPFARRDALNGIVWLRRAYAMFRAAPLRWLLLLFSYYLLIGLLELGPVQAVGQFVAPLLKPVFAVGFLAAAWSQERGIAPRFEHLFRGFRSNLLALVPLGAAFLVGITLALIATALVDDGRLMALISGAEKPTEEALASGPVQLAMLFGAVCAVPSLLALWFAPALVVFNDAGAVRALGTSLRAAIQSNPAFAPAYERLAAYLGMNHKNMDEAFSLIKTAVKLDPGNFYFRMNAGSVLMGMGKYTDAAATYGAAVKLARNPQQAAMAQTQVDQVQQFLQTRARMEQEQKQQSTVTAQEIRVVPVTATPKHPAEANGPKHTVSGKIKSVTCGYPATLEFELAGAAKTYRVYNNDFTKIDLSALGFTPNTMNPCSDLEGYAAKVQYAESTDSTVDGQVFAIELRK